MDKVDAAYQSLEAAIANVAALESDESEEPGLLIEWTLVTASLHYDNKGEQFTRTQILVPKKNDMPFYRLLGLLELGLCRIRASAIEDS